MRVTGFNWVGVLTDDFEETIHFFAEVLGLSLEYRDEAKDIIHFRLLSGQLLELYGPSNRQRKEKYRWFNGPVLGLEVEDLGAARQEMLAKGVRFITEVERDPPTGDAWSYFLGPEEKLFTIQQPVRRYPEEIGQISGFSWAGMVTQNFEGAVGFFSEVMEMPLTRRDDVRELAHFWLPAGQIFEVFGSHNHWSQLMPQLTIAFEVDDVGEARREMEKVGIEFISDVVVTPAGETFTYFRGPDGYLYEIWKLSQHHPARKAKVNMTR